MLRTPFTCKCRPVLQTLLFTGILLTYFICVLKNLEEKATEDVTCDAANTDKCEKLVTL